MADDVEVVEVPDAVQDGAVVLPIDLFFRFSLKKGFLADGINTSGFRHKSAMGLPHFDILRHYRQLGGTRITIGSEPLLNNAGVSLRRNLFTAFFLERIRKLFAVGRMTGWDMVWLTILSPPSGTAMNIPWLCKTV